MMVLLNIKPRYVLGIDPSGNYKEGKGTTGWCILDREVDKIIRCGIIQATSYENQEKYWLAHILIINDFFNEYQQAGLVVSIEEFILYPTLAKMQINSVMETSQLIGAIKMHCFNKNIMLYKRTASHVKKRLSDFMLCGKGYIRKANIRFFVDCKRDPLSDHERDAIRHAVHCSEYELGKRECNIADNRNEKDTVNIKPKHAELE